MHCGKQKFQLHSKPFNVFCVAEQRTTHVKMYNFCVYVFCWTLVLLKHYVGDVRK